MDTNPTGFQSQDILRAHLSDAGLKSWGARCGVQPLHSSRGSSGCETPTPFACGSLHWVWVYDKIVSQPLLPILMWVFFLFAQHAGVTQLLWGFLSERNCSMCSCRFCAYIRGGEFRILLCCYCRLKKNACHPAYLTSMQNTSCKMPGRVIFEILKKSSTLG